MPKLRLDDKTITARVFCCQHDGGCVSKVSFEATSLPGEDPTLEAVSDALTVAAASLGWQFGVFGARCPRHHRSTP